VPTWTLAYFTAQVNEANGRLDEAIEAYRSVLATKIPARKFDFSRDYEVNNSLALALYNRGRLEDLGSEERRSFMTEAATTWLRTIAADSENVSAHYGLGLAFADLSRGVGEAGERADEADVSAPEALLAAARGLSDPGLAAEARAAQAVALNGRIGRFLSSPRRDFSNRLDPMLELASILGSTYEEHKDPTVKASLAAALATTHKALHRMYRPDETAEGRAVAIARRASAAADQNAQSVVIHPLHRPGAPGLDRETPAKVAGPDATNSSPNATAVVEKSE
jgi:tetratricopeptide (TPR) repeat protein